MTVLDDRLKDEEYKAWLKTVLCFQFVRDGIVKFAEERSQELHQKILYNLRHYGKPAANKLCPDISFDVKKHIIVCKCRNCNDILTELKNHANKQLDLTNSDPRQLLCEHWQSAKLFMNHGQDVSNTHPNKTDISGLLNFIQNCKEAADCISDIQKVITVRDSRNVTIHSSNMKVKPADFLGISQGMLDLLEDKGNPTISSVCLLDDQHAQQAASNIKEVQKADFVISKDDETKVFKDLGNSMLMLIKDLTSEIKELKDTVSNRENQTQEEINQLIEKLHEKSEKINEVQTTLKEMQATLDTYIDQQDLRSLVSALEKSVETMKKDFDKQFDKSSGIIESLRKEQEGIKAQQQILTKQMQDNTLKLEEVTGDAQKLKTIPTEDDLQTLVLYLKEGYKTDKLKVPFFPGCYKIPVADIYAPVILIKGDLRETQTSGNKKRLCSYKDIFYQGEVPEKQVFLLGEAGSGKTTFCKHLTNVWCNESETSQFADPEVLRQFRFVLHVSCRFAKAKDSILDMICKQLFDDESMKSICMYMLRHNPEDCFIIVDGLDEWKCPPGKSFNRRRETPGLPYSAGVEGCFIFMTSRPWRFQALTTELEPKPKIFELAGLQSPKELILNILSKMGDSQPEGSRDKFLDQIDGCGMSEMMKTPLLLVTVLNIWTEDGTLHPSVCQNYMRMIESLIQRADDKKNWTGDEKRLMTPLVNNLATLKKKWKKKFCSLPSCCQEFETFKIFAGLIISLSRLAFDFLFDGSSTKQKLVFSKKDCKGYLCDEELNVCLGIGMISKSQSCRGIVKTESYAFPQKSYQEFLSALWLAGPGADSVDRIKEQIREKIKKDGFLKHVIGDLQLLIKFLSGLSPELGANILILIYKQSTLSNTIINDLRSLVLSCSVESQNCNITKDVDFDMPGIIVRKFMIMDENRMLPDILKSTSTGLRCLDIHHSSLDHSVVDKFYQSLNYCVNLENLWLTSISCNDDIHGNISSVLDLHKLYKLEKLLLWFLSATTVLLPQENSCLRRLIIEELELTHGGVDKSSDLSSSHSGIETFYQSLSCCINLQYLDLSSISCSDDCLDNISSVLDLQRLRKLEEITLENLSVKTVLLPQDKNPNLRCLSIDNIKLTHGSVEELSLLSSSYSCIEKFYQSLKCYINLKDLKLASISYSDDSRSNISSVLDLQMLNRLGNLKLKNLSVITVLLPPPNSCLSMLNITNLKLTHGSVEGLSDPPLSCIEQFYQSVSCCANIKYLKLVSISCSDDSRSNISSVLDLQKLHKLENLKLKNLSFITVLLPPLNSCLNELNIKNLKLTNGGAEVSSDLLSSYSCIEQFYQSLSSCVNIKYLKLVSISCSDDSRDRITPVLDFQKFHKLQTLKLKNLSVTTVSLPQDTNLCLRIMETTNLKLTHGGVEELYGKYCKCRFSPCLIKIENIYCFEHCTSCKDIEVLQNHLMFENFLYFDDGEDGGNDNDDQKNSDGAEDSFCHALYTRI